MNKIGQKNSGMIIILALLIIAAVLATAAIFGNLIIREIRQSRLIDQSIQAYYTAEWGAEKALYLVRKREAVKPAECEMIISGSSCRPDYSYCCVSDKCLGPDDQNVSCLMSSGTNLAISNEPETSFFLKKGDSFQIDLFHPYLGGDNPSNLRSFQIKTTKTNFFLYGELTNLTWLVCSDSSCPLNCQEVIIDPYTGRKEPAIVRGFIPIGDEPNSSVFASFGEGENQIENIDADCSYILRLINPLNIGQDDNFTVNIFSDSEGGNKIDIPSRLIIESTGVYGSASQRVTVRTPIRPPIAGLYDFVLFSEQEIVK